MAVIPWVCLRRVIPIPLVLRDRVSCQKYLSFARLRADGGGRSSSAHGCRKTPATPGRARRAAPCPRSVRPAPAADVGVEALGHRARWAHDLGRELGVARRTFTVGAKH